jgi:hypothetical protein
MGRMISCWWSARACRSSRSEAVADRTPSPSSTWRGVIPRSGGRAIGQAYRSLPQVLRLAIPIGQACPKMPQVFAGCADVMALISWADRDIALSGGADLSPCPLSVGEGDTEQRTSEHTAECRRFSHWSSWLQPISRAYRNMPRVLHLAIPAVRAYRNMPRVSYLMIPGVRACRNMPQISKSDGAGVGGAVRSGAHVGAGRGHGFVARGGARCMRIQLPGMPRSSSLIRCGAHQA